MDLTLYEILGVEGDATQAQLKQAFKELAIKFHPDKNPGNLLVEERFKAIASAYATLSDKKRRFYYDLYGKAALDGGPNGSCAQSPLETSQAREVFRSLFTEAEIAEGAAGAKPAHGDACTLVPNVLTDGGNYGQSNTVANANFGAAAEMKNIKHHIPNVGEKRSLDDPLYPPRQLRMGVDAADGYKRASCWAPAPTMLAHDQVQLPTPEASKPVEKSCTVKEYEVTVEELYARVVKMFRVTKGGVKTSSDQPATKHFLRVSLRPWWRDGHTIQHDSGDIIIKFVMRVAKHRHFELRGNDLVCPVRITLADAVVGVEAHIPTVEGTIVKIRKTGVIAPGMTYVVAGEGMPAPPANGPDSVGGPRESSSENTPAVALEAGGAAGLTQGAASSAPAAVPVPPLSRSRAWGEDASPAVAGDGPGARGDLVVVFDVVFPEKLLLDDDDSKRMLHDALSGRIRTLCQ
eukprot:Opistho-2@36737